MDWSPHRSERSFVENRCVATPLPCRREKFADRCPRALSKSAGLGTAKLSIEANKVARKRKWACAVLACFSIVFLGGRSHLW